MAIHQNPGVFILQRLKTKWGVILTAVLLTIIVLLESIFPPWAPYFIIYAFLAVVIPVILKTFSFGNLRTVIKTNWKITVFIFIIALVWDTGVCNLLYEKVLAAAGLGGNPFFSLNAAIGKTFELAGRKLGLSLNILMGIYAFFYLIWAPIGEELFYRGYMQGSLQGKWGFTASALISSVFFGLRHATHFFFLWPDVPLAAAAQWTLSAFVFGLMMSCLYEKTKSLYPAVLVHFAVNLIGITFV